MGKKDTITKEYMRDAATFADAFNFFMYDGRQVIKPEQLHELDTASIVLKYGDDLKVNALQKYRDILKVMTAKADEHTAYLILGIEDQTKINYAMPVRSALYDTMQYANQVEKISRSHIETGNYGTPEEFLSGFHKDDKITPVVTLVIYFGAKPWDAPRSLHEMMSINDGQILSFIPDYRINLIAPDEIADKDFEKFRTDLSKVLKFVKYSNDKYKLKAMIDEDDAFKKVSRKTALTISEITGLKLKIKSRKDEVNMCQGVADMISDAVAEKEREMCKGVADMISDAVAEKEREMCKGIADMISDAVAEKEKEFESKISDAVAEKEREMCKGIADMISDAVAEKETDSIKRMLSSDKQFSFEEIAGFLNVPVEMVEKISNEK